MCVLPVFEFESWLVISQRLECVLPVFEFESWLVISHRLECVFHLCLSLRSWFKTESKTMANVSFWGKCCDFHWQILHILLRNSFNFLVM